MFGSDPSWTPLQDMPDLTGKVMLVTGANAGIGFEITKALAANGAKVYLGARSEERAMEAIRKIEEACPEVRKNGNLIWLPLDLTHPADVIKSAKDFMAREERLDVLINNAARLPSDFTLSDYGVELSTAINHVGHFVLVESLMPILKATAARPNSDVRIAIMSSGIHYLTPKVASVRTVEELNRPWASYATSTSYIGKGMRYAFTKMLNEWFKFELQRRLDSEHSNIIVLSMHPGLIATDNNLASSPFLLRSLLWFAAAPGNGTTSALFAATAAVVRKEPQKYKAAYLTPSGVPKPASKQARNPELAGELWMLTREIVDNVLAEKV